MNEIEELIKKNKKRIKENELEIEKGVYAYEESCLWRDNARLFEVNEELNHLEESLTQDAEEQREITDKVIAYDQLDHKFKLVCGKGIEGTLQHLCLVGFGDGSKVNHEPVEVPELKFPQAVVDWLGEPLEMDHDDLIAYIMQYYWNEDSAYDNALPSEVGEYLAESLSNVVKLLRALEGECYTVAKIIGGEVVPVEEEAE